MRMMVVLVMVATCCGMVSAAEIKNGRMVLPAKIGDVLFDHDAHIGHVMRDCKACHEKEGQIMNLTKKFAHDLCIECHKKDYGGPVTCDGCHGKVTG